MGPKRTKAERLKISGISLLVIGLVFFLSGLIITLYYRRSYTLGLYGIIGLGLGCSLFTIGVGLWGGSRRKVKMSAMKNKWIAFIIGIILVGIFIITMFILPPPYTRPYTSMQEGIAVRVVKWVIPIICVTIGGIFLIIFVVKLIRGKD